MSFPLNVFSPTVLLARRSAKSLNEIMLRKLKVNGA